MFNVIKGAALAVAMVALPGTVLAGDNHATKTVAEIHAQKAELSGKRVHLQGKVVKVNNGIMGKNFLHIQDGSGSAAQGDNDITVTTQQTANVGDELSIDALVTVDRDFGYGYKYALILEEAKLTR